MVELMASLAILSLGITALLQTLWGGILYANDTENNIKAINIAREWIETVINIRDTNWLRFSSDRTHCWIVKDYDATCIGDLTPAEIGSWTYTVVWANWAWYLSWVASGVDPIGNWPVYKEQFKVGVDAEWFYTQTGVSSIGCSSERTKDCLTSFTREIYIMVSWWTVNVQSIARWNLERPRSVTIQSTLTNWKSRF
jgi:type II secretory pathway pseudopilin PulG